MASGSGAMAGRAGRPPKFDEPCRVVTVTLPERTLEDLSYIDRDRARAIVKATSLARHHPPGEALPQPPRDVDLMRVAPESAVIALSSARSLEGIPGLTLVEFMPSRFLIIVGADTSLSDVEIAILDRQEALPPEAAREREMLHQLLDHLRTGRRSNRLRTGGVILLDVA
jgi:hypothetical protein